jgi:beta-lactam-binding protein with PASTA domain
LGDSKEQEVRQSKYAQADVPLGVCWEIRWWYGSIWYRNTPDVTGRDISIAVQLIQNVGLVPVIHGPTTNSKVVSQSPQGGAYLPIWSAGVTLTTASLVVLPNFKDWSYEDAKEWLDERGIHSERDPQYSTNYVDRSKPGANGTVTPGVDTVTLYLHEDDGGVPP